MLGFLRFLVRWFKRLAVLAAVALVVFGVYMAVRLTGDEAEAFTDPVAHFKYGSTGGDRNFGLPYEVWQVLPDLFGEHMPPGRAGEGWAAFGFVYEDEDDRPVGMKPRPVGTSLRAYMGVDRIFLNCAGCHAGTVERADGSVAIYAGMPANTIDLQAFQDFLIAAAKDERFTPEDILAKIDNAGIGMDWINRLIMRFYGIYQVRQRILTIADRFGFADYEPHFGPGRFDTFSPAKALFNWPIDAVPEHERIGVVDFPSVWLQRPRRGMQLHWDGNNTKVEERNRSAAFGTGATPPILDRASLQKFEDWLLDVPPPSFSEAFPDHFDADLANLGADVYADTCAACHGLSGRNFAGAKVGTVTPIEEIGTDRYRLDNYTQDLAFEQNMLYAGWGEERFQNFRKTQGYANAPLDGLWLRAPYLHNGSVPTLKALLDPPEQRPLMFLRGSARYDPIRVGFESRPSRFSAGERARLFCFQTRSITPSRGCGGAAPDNNGVCDGGACPGNGSGGHLYGTDLPAADKRALIEHLKTF